MKKVYHTMNDVPVGTEMVIKKDGRKGKLKEIIAFPTTFKIELEDGTTKCCYTFEVNITGWPPNENI